jgi:hypothetical protein
MVGENMELKDMILSTLAELEEAPSEHKEQTPETKTETIPAKTSQEPAKPKEYETESISDVKFLQNVRERILVLFEGFQSPNNQNIDAKVDLTLNFLEYLLASIDEQLEKRESSLRL